MSVTEDCLWDQNCISLLYCVQAIVCRLRTVMRVKISTGGAVPTFSLCSCPLLKTYALFLHRLCKVLSKQKSTYYSHFVVFLWFTSIGI